MDGESFLTLPMQELLQRHIASLSLLSRIWHAASLKTKCFDPVDTTSFRSNSQSQTVCYLLHVDMLETPRGSMYSTHRCLHR